MAGLHITLDKFRKPLKCILPEAVVLEAFRTATFEHQKAVAVFLRTQGHLPTTAITGDIRTKERSPVTNGENAIIFI
jgi:hypothetical protein